MTFTYHGVTRRGGHVTGTFTAEDCADFVAAKYRARWQHLQVQATDATDLCGAIFPNDDNGRREWWAETSN